MFSDERSAIESRFKAQMHATSSVLVAVPLTVNSASKTLSRSSDSFVTEGVTVGSYVSLQGFVNEGNNQVFEVLAVAALSLTLSDPLGILVSEIGTITSYGCPAYPIVFENIAFEVKDANQFFVTCYVVEGSGEQITLGTKPFFRFIGFVQNSIFGPEGVGTGQFKVIADRIAGFWRNAQFSNGSSGYITCGTPSCEFLDYRTYARLGLRDGQYRLDVVTPYHRDIQY